jgi:hypothetical protein
MQVLEGNGLSSVHGQSKRTIYQRSHGPDFILVQDANLRASHWCTCLVQYPTTSDRYMLLVDYLFVEGRLRAVFS